MKKLLSITLVCFSLISGTAFFMSTSSQANEDCMEFSFKRVGNDPTPCQGDGSDCPLKVCADDKQ